MQRGPSAVCPLAPSNSQGRRPSVGRQWLAALGVAASLTAAAVTEAALGDALADVSARPESARVRLRPFAQHRDEAAIAGICVAYGRSMDTRVHDAEHVQTFAGCEHAAKAGQVAAPFHPGQFHAWGIGTDADSRQALSGCAQVASHGHAQAGDAKRGLEGKAPVRRNPIPNCRMF